MLPLFRAFVIDSLPAASEQNFIILSVTASIMNYVEHAVNLTIYSPSLLQLRGDCTADVWLQKRTATLRNFDSSATNNHHGL